MKDRPLTKIIIEEIVDAGTRVLFINRQYFDQDRGAELLKRVYYTLHLLLRHQRGACKQLSDQWLMCIAIVRMFRLFVVTSTVK